MNDFVGTTTTKSFMISTKSMDQEAVPHRHSFVYDDVFLENGSIPDFSSYTKIFTAREQTRCGVSKVNEILSEEEERGSDEL